MTRRRFQFRLRTLFVVVTVVAVACGYIGHEWRIVRERQYKEIRYNGDISGRYRVQPIPGAVRPASISWLRQFLGDRPVKAIFMQEGSSADERRRLQELFPEARLVWWDDDHTGRHGAWRLFPDESTTQP
jgi:hypothetical protein